MAEDHDMVARRCLRSGRGCMTDDQYTEAVRSVTVALQEAFDTGFMAAGGTVTPLSEIPVTFEKR